MWRVKDTEKRVYGLDFKLSTNSRNLCLLYKLKVHRNQRLRQLISLRKQTFAPPPPVCPRITSVEIPCWWRITTQIWIVLLTGWSKISPSRSATQIWVVTRPQYGIAAAVPQTSLVSLRNRTGKEKKDDGKLCDKRDNNLVSKNLPPNFTFLSTDLFVYRRAKNINVKWIPKHACNSPVTFVILKCFAVLFFLPSCYVKLKLTILRAKTVVASCREHPK